MSHTPIPWRATTFGVFAGETEVADCAPHGHRQDLAEVSDNAEFIVLACNLFDQLVTALQAQEHADWAIEAPDEELYQEAIDADHGHLTTGEYRPWVWNVARRLRRDALTAAEEEAAKR